MCCPPALSEGSLPESQACWSAVLGTGLGTVVTPGWPQDRAGSTSTAQVLLKQAICELKGFGVPGCSRRSGHSAPRKGRERLNSCKGSSYFYVFSFISLFCKICLPYQVHKIWWLSKMCF